jgi:hypothetical protein
MAIQKFKTFEEAERALWNFNPDEKYYQQVADLFRLMEKLHPLQNEKGVFKFRTFEEAQAHRVKTSNPGLK